MLLKLTTPCSRIFGTFDTCVEYTLRPSLIAPVFLTRAEWRGRFSEYCYSPREDDEPAWGLRLDALELPTSGAQGLQYRCRHVVASSLALRQELSVCTGWVSSVSIERLSSSKRWSSTQTNTGDQIKISYGLDHFTIGQVSSPLFIMRRAISVHMRCAVLGLHIPRVATPLLTTFNTEGTKLYYV